MAVNARRTLEEYLALNYSFNVVADQDGGYVILFPDLPGCMSQVETLDEIGPVADEIRTLWIETEYERGADIPMPSYPEEYSGKFNVRLPRSLHRRLVESAQREGVSLNQHVVALLSLGSGVSVVDSRLALLERRQDRLEHLIADDPGNATRRRSRSA